MLYNNKFKHTKEAKTNELNESTAEFKKQIKKQMQSKILGAKHINELRQKRALGRTQPTNQPICETNSESMFVYKQAK